MPSERMLLCGFGPVVSDGYGICYNPQKKQILFTVSASRKCHKTDATKFISKLSEALNQMKNILESQCSTAKL